MNGLKVGLIGTALSAAYLPLGNVNVPTSVDEVAGKDANYILAAVCIVLVYAVWKLVMFYKEAMDERKKLQCEMQSVLISMSERQTEALTKVADALARCPHNLNPKLP